MVQCYLAQLAVAADWRRQGIARRLVSAVATAAGVSRIDVLVDDATAFYQSLPHRSMTGFRLYPKPGVTHGPSEPAMSISLNGVNLPRMASAAPSGTPPSR